MIFRELISQPRSRARIAHRSLPEDRFQVVVLFVNTTDLPMIESAPLRLIFPFQSRCALPEASASRLPKVTSVRSGESSGRRDVDASG